MTGPAHRPRRALTSLVAVLLALGATAPAIGAASPPGDGGQGGRGRSATPVSAAPVQAVAAGTAADAPAAAGTSTANRLGDYSAEDYAAMKAAARVPAAAEAADRMAPALDQDEAAGPVGPVGPAAPALGSNWTSFSYTGWIPPDSHVAAGPEQVVAVVNGGLKVFSKTGLELQSYTLDSFFPAESRCAAATCSGYTTFDPWVVYDAIDGRFVVLALSKNSAAQKNRILVATSKSNTTSAGWRFYSWDGTLRGTTAYSEWVDYAKVGVTSNALVIAGNAFSWAGSFQTAKVKVLWKSQLYNGQTANSWDFWNLSGSPFTLQPAHSSATGTIGYLLNTSSGSSSTLAIRKVSVPTTPGTAPTMYAPTNRTVTSYSAPPDAVQPGTSTRLDTGDARLMQAVRTNAGIYAVHSTSCTWSGVADARSCLQWFHVRASDLALLDQGTFGNSGYFYAYPAVAANPAGGVVIPFQYSGSDVYMTVRYTARPSSGGSLQNSSLLMAGTRCYVRLDSSGRNRQGDYSGASYDATSGRFYVMGQYSTGSSSTCGSNTWSTRIGSVAAP